MRPQIYIAGPVTTGDRVENIRAACVAADTIVELGGEPVVPHDTLIREMVTPHNYDYWMDRCLFMVSRCDGLLRLDGNSYGADLEVDDSYANGIPVFYEMGHLHEWIEANARPQIISAPLNGLPLNEWDGWAEGDLDG